MLEKVKEPKVLAPASLAALMIIGTGMGWFTIENELVRSFAEEELASKETAVYVVGLIIIFATMAAAALQKKAMVVVSLLVGLYGAVLIYNQLPDKQAEALLLISANLGYWLALLGAFGSVIASGVLLVKGFDSK